MTKKVALSIGLVVWVMIGSVRADAYTSVTGSLNRLTTSSTTFGSTVTGSVTDSALDPSYNILINAVLSGTDFVSTAAGTPSAALYIDNAAGFVSGANARLTGNLTLTGDQTAQSLKFGGNYTLTLGGLTTIESGGILFANNGSITGGSLQANSGKNLWIVQSGNYGNTISSNIVGIGGLELYTGYSTGGSFTLSGNNTFTGNIWLGNASGGQTLNVNSATALGEGTDVYIVNNVATIINFGASGAVNGSLDGAVITQNFTFGGAANNAATFNSGTNNVTLSGNITRSGGINIGNNSGGSMTFSGTVNLGGGNIAGLSANAVANFTNYVKWVGGGNITTGTFNISGTFIAASDMRVSGSASVNLLDGAFVQTAANKGVEVQGNIQFNQNGGTLSGTGGSLVNITSPSLTSGYNLNGGVMIDLTKGTGNVINSTAFGVLALNSGTIQVNGNTTRTLMNSGTTLVKSGGGFFSVQSGTLIASLPLLHDSSLGNNRDGGITMSGPGTLLLNGANTYTGNTVVSAGIFTLNTGASMLFTLVGNDNNAITGVGIVNLNGTIFIDVSGAAATGSWDVIDVAGLAAVNYGANFTVSGWTQQIDDTNIWTSGNYTFNAGTGMVSAIPEPPTMVLTMIGAAILLVTTFRSRRSLH
jgi:autotransporter-associated beta strand protein